MSRPAGAVADKYLAVLRQAGVRGVLAVRVCAAMGTTQDNANFWLHRLCASGQAGWWPDPVGRTINRRRYWAAELRPACCPAPSGEPTAAHVAADVCRRADAPGAVVQQLQRADGVVVTRLAGWTHDPRYQVPPGAQPYGAGFAAVGMGRDVMTGRAWGASA
jgi:hypothetical protein